LAEVIMRDSAEIQEEDAEYKRRRHKKEGRTGKYPVRPLYTEADVVQTLPLLEGVPYDTAWQVTDSVSVVFRDAGHILGSAMLQLLVTEQDKTYQVIFSGDIGQWNKPLLRDPSLFESADYVVMESTYGDRAHRQDGDVEEQLCDVINETFRRGGNVVIPTFAVERAQEVMYFISRLVHANKIPAMKVFLDSPMAVDVTDIFLDYRECFDEETARMIDSQQPPLRFPGLQMTRTSAESKAINNEEKPCIIMATSGMCTAGRVKHHLRKNIHRRESTVLFVGYQAHGTLGRQIRDGNPTVRIHGRNYDVKAQIAQIYGFSGHADRDALLRWIGNMKGSPKHVFLAHGEEDAAESLAQAITQQNGCPVSVPAYQEVVELG
jgi:metallo-beta-lactamase family protein